MLQCTDSTSLLPYIKSPEKYVKEIRATGRHYENWKNYISRVWCMFFNFFLFPLNSQSNVAQRAFNWRARLAAFATPNDIHAWTSLSLWELNFCKNFVCFLFLSFIHFYFQKAKHNNIGVNCLNTAVGRWQQGRIWTDDCLAVPLWQLRRGLGERVVKCCHRWLGGVNVQSTKLHIARKLNLQKLAIQFYGV